MSYEKSMVEVEMTTLEIAEITGKKHSKVMRDCRYVESKIGQSKFGLAKIGQAKFGQSSYMDEQGKPRPMYILDKMFVNTLMCRYSVEHAYMVVSKVYQLEEELGIMKNIVWEVINGQALLGQEQALKMAGIKHPRLIMKYIKGNEKFFESLQYESHYLKVVQCNKHGDEYMKFTKLGFKWLLGNRDVANRWVEYMKKKSK